MVLSVVALVLLVGCAHPISADKVSFDAAFEQSTVSALSGSRCSSETRLVLHRLDLEERFKSAPAETLRELHQKACVDERRDLLFALSELSYLHAKNLLQDRSLKPWVPKPARDYFLCSALYAHLYLFGEGAGKSHGPFEPQFRAACDLYNRGLARGFTPKGDTNGQVVLETGVRSLPPGAVKLEFSQRGFPWDLKQFDQFLSADSLMVRGLTVRNKQAGLGATLVGIVHATNSAHLSRSVPATLILRAAGGVRQWSAGEITASLELYSGYDKPTVEIAGQQIPVRTDTTAPLARTMNQESVWKLGMEEFFSWEQVIPSDVYPTQPYQAGRVPVVFVHGTFSSPVWWAEMFNTLRADPELSARYQFWYYIYNSGNPIPYSAAHFRDALTNAAYHLDPEGKDAALQEMVVIGHSQGGLLAKLAVIDPGDQLWKALTDRPLDALKLTAGQRDELERGFFFKPVTSVKRVVFISTPHRGSFLATSFVRGLVARFISLPPELLRLRKNLTQIIKSLQLPPELRDLPSSVNGMSPNNRILLALADIPPASGVAAHSIISVKGKGDPADGDDGVVKYKSAHVPYVESEFIVRSKHSCQARPATIEEVRRILLEHLRRTPRAATTSQPQPQ